MRIMLIYPPITTQERYSSGIGHSGGKQIPLGVFTLGAYVRSKGHETSVIDAEAEKLTTEETLGRALAFNPDILGISSTTVAFHRALDLARAFKQVSPATYVVLGGPHISAAPEDAMAHEDFDYGVAGEGELPFAALIQALEEGRDPSDTPGIAYRKDGRVVVNPRAAYITDLDELPFPAFDLVSDLTLYNPPACNYKRIPVANVITGRGCPNLCTFCDRSVFGTKLRQRSAGSIAREINWLYHDFGVREIAFLDDTFTIGKKRIYELFDLLGKQGVHFPWTCMSRINTVDKALLTFMRDHGCWHISFGIESGSQEILRLVNKNISLDKAREVIGWCRELGILTKGFFIMGHPGETVETLDQTIEVSLKLPLDDAVITLNTPLPGSDQYRDALMYGQLDPPDWTKFNLWNPVFVPHGLTKDIILKKQKEMYRRFYFRPRIMWRYFLSFFSLAGLRRAFSLLRSLPYLFAPRQA